MKGKDASSQQVHPRFQSPPSVTAAAGSNKPPWSVLVRVLPLTPTSFSVGGLHRSFLLKLHLGRGNFRRREQESVLEGSWMIQTVSGSFNRTRQLSLFYIFHSCKRSPIKGWQSFTRAVRQKLGKLYKLFFYICHPSISSFLSHQHIDCVWKHFLLNSFFKKTTMLIS